MRKKVVGFSLSFTKVLLLIVAIVTLLTGGLLVFTPQQQTKKVISSQLDETSRALSYIQEAERQLTRLGSPDSTPLQQIGKVKPYVHEFFESAEIVRLFAGYSLAPPNTQWFTPVSKNKQGIQNFNKILSSDSTKLAYSQTPVLLSETYSLINHQALVLQMFTNLLEYNPKQDFRSFDKNSPDTQKRLKAAKEGLAKMLDELVNFKSDYQDPTLEQLEKIVTSLQSDRDKLETDGDVKTWSDEIYNKQQQIITNRQLFWKSRVPALANHLYADEYRLDQLHTSLEQIRL